MLKVKRYFLEIDPLGFNNKNIDPPQNVRITLDIKKDFNINKFFYKQIGAEHYWRDRLVWSDKEWINYVSNINFENAAISLVEGKLNIDEDTNSNLESLNTKSAVSLPERSELGDYHIFNIHITTCPHTPTT